MFHAHEGSTAPALSSPVSSGPGLDRYVTRKSDGTAPTLSRPWTGEPNGDGPTLLTETESVADGLLPLITGELTFEHARDLLDDVITVSDEAIQEVPDPYYGGGDGFVHMYDLIEAGCDGLLEDLLTADEA